MDNYLHSTIMDKFEILMIGPLPPPTGGQSILVNTIVKSGHIEKITYKVLNVAHNEQSTLGRVNVSIKFLAKLFQLLFKKHRTVQLVHIHTSAGIAFYEKGIMGIISRVFHIPVILHIHGGKLEYMLHEANRFKLFFIRYILSRMSRIVVLSNHMCQVISQTSITQTPVVVLGNPSTISFEHVHQKNANQSNHVTLLFVGHIKPEKGLLDLLAAYMDLKTDKEIAIRLIIVGAGDTQKNEDYVKKEFYNAGAKDVIFTGVLNGEALVKVYSDADIFVLPSHSEDQPLTILEAMSCGVPIVASDVGSISEVVINGINGFLIQPKDIDGLKNRLDLLCRDKQLRDVISEANLSNALEQFSIERYMRNLKRLYVSILQ